MYEERKRKEKKKVLRENSAWFCEVWCVSLEMSDNWWTTYIRISRRKGVQEHLQSSVCSKTNLSPISSYCFRKCPSLCVWVSQPWWRLRSKWLLRLCESPCQSIDPLELITQVHGSAAVRFANLTTVPMHYKQEDCVPFLVQRQKVVEDRSLQATLAKGDNTDLVTLSFYRSWCCDRSLWVQSILTTRLSIQWY